MNNTNNTNVESLSDYSYNLEAEFNRVCDQRDELLAACNVNAKAYQKKYDEAERLLTALCELVEQVEHYADADDCDLPDTSHARRVIAKANQ